MKKSLVIVFSIMLLLSLFACSKTEISEKGDDVQNEQNEENKQSGEENPKPNKEEPIPTNPVSKEVYDLKHNGDIVHVPLSYYEQVFTNGTGITKGAVEIWGYTANDAHLQINFFIRKQGENAYDATVGYDKEDMSAYHFSFKLYLREQGAENAEYKTIHKNLVPWSIYNDPASPMYRCPFYDSGLLDIVEVGKTYDTVIAIYENDKVVAWGESELTWYEDSQNFVEQAEQNEDIIK